MINERELIQEAIEARKSSHSPYSHFAVGAALLKHKKGDVVKVNAPDGEYKLLIKEILED